MVHVQLREPDYLDAVWLNISPDLCPDTTGHAHDPVHCTRVVNAEPALQTQSSPGVVMSKKAKIIIALETLYTLLSRIRALRRYNIPQAFYTTVSIWVNMLCECMSTVSFIYIVYKDKN